MIIAIDVGNTNTVLAVCEAGRILTSWRCQSRSGRTGDEYAAWLIPLFQKEGYLFDNIENVIVSSVVPEANFNLVSFCEYYMNCTPAFVRSGETDFGIDIQLDDPASAGSDRLVNAVAVGVHYRTPAIVIDFGTATTFDVIGEDGAYIGGAIAPGINLSLNALHHAAAKLPKVSISKPQKPLGKNTSEAMRSGIYWGYVGLINGMIDKLSETFEEMPFVIATGGLAHVYEDDLPALQTIDDDLTLKGLLEIYRRNI